MIREVSLRSARAAARVLVAALACAVVAEGWDVGFNFRGSAGFVVDPPSTTFISMTTNSYPTTRTIGGQTVTFGWETVAPSGNGGADRQSYYDPRLAGTICQSNSATSVFRVDLPASGNYLISLAVGDGEYGSNNHVQVAGGTGSPLVVVNAANPYYFFYDATGVSRYGPAWPSTNVTVQKSFSSTILRLQIGGQNDGGYSCITHLRVTTAPTVVTTLQTGQFILQ